MAKNVAYKEIFEKLGEHWHLHENIIEELESFAFNLYSHGRIKDSNLLWCRLFCVNKGISPYIKLPLPNYQWKTWRDCISDQFFSSKSRRAWLSCKHWWNSHNLDGLQTITQWGIKSNFCVKASKKVLLFNKHFLTGTIFGLREYYLINLRTSVIF